MIPEGELKKQARLLGVDAGVLDRDHALGVVLWALAPDLDAAGWVFKGGTCLRKCYFGDYRFSEDLDFTATGALSTDAVRALVTRAASRTPLLGVTLSMELSRIEVKDDEYGRESIEIKVPYRGVLQSPNRPNVQFHVSAHEEMAFSPQARPLIHEYADSGALGDVSVACYSLDEVLTEKLRAIGGQRRFAIARDVYDIAQLASRGADTGAAIAALPEKARFKGVALDGAAQRFRDRRADFEHSWDSTLAYLVVDDMTFDHAFDVAAALLDRAASGHAGL
jgi:predicted nucleotidyltransferase component of viral defense system